MADVGITLASNNLTAGYARTHALTAAQLTGAVTGSWVGPCGAWRPRGIAVTYDETGGGVTDVNVSARVRVAGASTAFILYNAAVATGPWGAAITATGHYFFPIAPLGPTAGAYAALVGGIDEITLVATFSGTGTTGGVFNAWIVGEFVR